MQKQIITTVIHLVDESELEHVIDEHLPIDSFKQKMELFATGKLKLNLPEDEDISVEIKIMDVHPEVERKPVPRKKDGKG